MREQLTGDRHRIAVDIDGTITDGHSRWWDGNWGEPHEQAIDWVNQQYINGHTIMLHTARPESVRAGTEAWLADHGVRYHTLVMDKLSADMYVDNRGVPALAIQQDDAADVGDIGQEIIDAFDEKTRDEH